MNKKMIIDAYCRIRKIDNSIPDDVLDFMKDSAIEKLKEMKNKKECEHPYYSVHTRCFGEINHCYQCGKDL